MKFNPIEASGKILKDYVGYLRTTFFINDDTYMQKFSEQLLEHNYLSKGPFIDVTDSFKTGCSLRDLINEGVASAEFERLQSEGLPLDRPLYKHQEQAIREISQGNNAIITTGTGSGKTESFLLPILNYLMREKEEGTLSDGVRAIIIYPMNALANDQMKRLRTILRNYPDITFGTYTGETEEQDNRAYEKYLRQYKTEPLPNERISRAQIKVAPPHLIITNYAMLEYLLLRPNDNTIFSGKYGRNWKFIVLDEAHTYSGATGIEVSVLIKRLKARIQNDNRINYILTSATLGSSTDDNPDIVHFAKTLCSDESFFDSSIIRADRVMIKPPRSCRTYHPDCYEVINTRCEQTDSPNEIHEMLSRYNPEIKYSENIAEMIFDFLHEDGIYYTIKNLLNEEALSVHMVSKRLGLDEKTLVSFISLASKARKNGVELFDGRYHYFIKALAGAYISLAPFKEIFLEPFYQYEDHKVFRFSVCRSCGQIYLTGKMTIDENTGKRQFTSKLEPDDAPEYYILTDKFKDDAEKDNFIICSKCGTVACAGERNLNFCKCSFRYVNYITRVNSEKTLIKHCECCDYTNNHSGILRDFYVGQDAATSVVATSLYGVLPSAIQKAAPVQAESTDDEFGFGFEECAAPKNELISEALTKQYLIFSDSRQQAAYFASYFDGTYHNILRRRVLIEILKNNRRSYEGGVSVKRLCEDLYAAFNLYQIFDEDDREKEAYKTIIYEMVSNDRHGLEGLGIIRFSFNTEMHIGVFRNNETQAVINVLADSFRRDICLYYDNICTLTPEDKTFFQYASYDRGYVLNPADKTDYNYCWLAKVNDNYRTSFLKRLSMEMEGAEWSLEKCNNFLSAVWNRVFKPCLKTNDNLHYRLDITSFKIYSVYSENRENYFCNKCGRLTSSNADDICPTFRCDGRLSVFNRNSQKDNHYINIYTNLNIYDLKIKEHTAQLSVDKAKEYQEAFVNKKINILSCSTTFEMGVDVGDLETVMMKNMPPTPANYIQRVGRAGRRTDSAAYALTFCKTDSHDTNFFNHPSAMIKGNIKPPYFTTENEKIVRRHAYAVCLSEFFRKNPNSFKDAETLMLTSYFSLLMQFVESSHAFLSRIVSESTPASLHGKIDLWLEMLVSDDGELMIARDTLKNDIEKLEEAYQLAKTQMEEKNQGNYAVIRIQKEIRSLKSENIIAFLSRNNIIPRYGFPVDCVELKTRQNNDYTKGPLRLQRDMKIAVSEYAPGSQIIADGMLYTSRYITRPANNNHDWRMYDFGYCENPECENVNVNIHTFDEHSQMGVCKYCHSGNVRKTGTFIVPSYGFTADINVAKANMRKPEKTYNGRIHYIGDRNARELSQSKQHAIGDRVITVISSSNDELLIMNNSEFYVCQSCGYAMKTSLPFAPRFAKSKGSHKTPFGRDCTSDTLVKRSLGHMFKTDVVCMNFDYISDRGERYSLLYALLEGISRFLEIERTDIDGCAQTVYNNGKYETSVIIFDNVPGGAGHVSRIAGFSTEQFKKVLDAAYDVVAECTCGGKTGDAACYNCLCNYSNQFIHPLLNRQKAINYLSNLKL